MAEIILTEKEKLYIRNQVKIKDFEIQIEVIKTEKEVLLIEKDTEKDTIRAVKDTNIQKIQKEIEKLK